MTTFCVERKHDGPCYWLASETDGKITLHDGCHSTPRGCAEAAKLLHRIFGRDDDYFVVKVEPIPPWGDIPINEEAARTCADMIASANNHKNEDTNA